MSYQTFPWKNGDSRSYEKLVSLYLPDLKGKRVLDIGCNTGYFCGWAAFQEAALVKGIDNNHEAIEEATAFFPQCSFECRNWEDLGSETYDLILCLSAIQYAEDQKQLIDTLMQRVNSHGLLVLEIGIALGTENEFKKVKRAIDTRLFPTQKRLHSMLEKYAFKCIRQSVSQDGDPLPRFVYHIYHKLPMAVLLLDNHYAGKTSVASTLFKKELKRISGDTEYWKICHEPKLVPVPLIHIFESAALSRDFDWLKVTQTICKEGLLPHLVHYFVQQAEGKNFILDHYIPGEFRLEFCQLLSNSGYFVCDLAIFPQEERDWTKKRTPNFKYLAYQKHLEHNGLIDQEEYCQANPDVAKAIEENQIPNAQFHYFHFGRHEGRKLRTAKFISSRKIGTNP